MSIHSLGFPLDFEISQFLDVSVMHKKCFDICFIFTENFTGKQNYLTGKHQVYSTIFFLKKNHILTLMHFLKVCGCSFFT